jgi:hypothetical protein
MNENIDWVESHDGFEPAKSLKHNGWFVDGFQDETIIPGVIVEEDECREYVWCGVDGEDECDKAYKCSKNCDSGMVVKYRPAIKESRSDQIGIVGGELCDTRLDAELVADGEAESYAEKAREYWEKDQIEHLAEENAEEIAELEKTLLAPMPDEARKLVKKEIKRLRKEIEKFTENPGLLYDR